MPDAEPNHRQDCGTPALALRGERERKGCEPAHLAKVAGISLPSYYDLESHNDDWMMTISIGSLRLLCSELGVAPQRLFSVGASAELTKVNAETIAEKLVDYLSSKTMSVADFEEKIGYCINGFIDKPNEIASWNIDCLRAVCCLLGVDWRAVL